MLRISMRNQFSILSSEGSLSRLNMILRGSSNKEFFYSAVNLHSRHMISRSKLARLFGCSHVPFSTHYILPTFVARQH